MLNGCGCRHIHSVRLWAHFMKAVGDSCSHNSCQTGHNSIDYADVFFLKTKPNFPYVTVYLIAEETTMSAKYGSQGLEKALEFHWHYDCVLWWLCVGFQPSESRISATFSRFISKSTSCIWVCLFHMGTEHCIQHKSVTQRWCTRGSSYPRYKADTTLQMTCHWGFSFLMSCTTFILLQIKQSFHSWGSGRGRQRVHRNIVFFCRFFFSEVKNSLIWHIGFRFESSLKT